MEGVVHKVKAKRVMMLTKDREKEMVKMMMMRCSVPMQVERRRKWIRMMTKEKRQRLESLPKKSDILRAFSQSYLLVCLSTSVYFGLNCGTLLVGL
jgi:hypothetical protein